MTTLRVRLTPFCIAVLVTAAACGGPGEATGRDGDGGRPADAAAVASPVDTTPRTLRITSHPAAEVIAWAGGHRFHARTPWRARVPAGTVRFELRRAGYNSVHRTFQLTTARSFEAWLDPAGLLLASRTRWSTGSTPKQVAFTPDGRQAWVTLLGAHGVQVFDTGSGRLLDAIPLGADHGAVEVIFTRDGETAYVSQMETASVFEIDVHTREIRRRLYTKGIWSKVMALSPDERTLYVSNWVSDDVSAIDLETEKVRRYATVDTPRGLYVTPEGDELYVAGFADGEIERVDLETGHAETLIRTGGAMRHLVGDPRDHVVYASDMAEDKVFEVDLDTGDVTTLARVDHNPNTIDLDPQGRVLYVSCRGRNGPSYYLPGPEWGSVVLVDTENGRLLDAIVGGEQTTGLDVSADGRMLAFSDFLGNRVSTYAIPPYRELANGGGRVREHRAELEK
ncbi:MAG: YncE family protein [Carbonactinosporaceae bacterium]